MKMTLSRNKKLSLLLAGVTVLLVGVTVPSAGAAADRFGEYVALGDSWAADATINPARVSEDYAPRGCGQSVGSYARQVAAALAVPVFRDASCGSAVTASMTENQALHSGGMNPPQFDRLRASTDLVTVMIGGNDAGLAAAVEHCLTVDASVSPCLSKFTRDGVDLMSTAIAATQPKVAAVVEGIRHRSPGARILLVNYLNGLGGSHCFPQIPLSVPDSTWLGAKLFELDAMLAQVAESTGVELVDTYVASAGHDACQVPGVRWVEGMVPFTSDPIGPAVPFHPNQLGADHQARSVLAALGRG